jgi:uridylate kinase
MALNSTTLASALENAIKNIDAESDDTRKKMAEAIATEVVNHIKNNGVVTVASGIPVATAGTAAAQTGATTSTGTGTIS